MRHEVQWPESIEVVIDFPEKFGVVFWAASNETPNLTEDLVGTGKVEAAIIIIPSLNQVVGL